MKYFYSSESAARELGMSADWFDRYAEGAAEEQPHIFEGETNEKKFWTRDQIDNIREMRKSRRKPAPRARGGINNSRYHKEKGLQLNSEFADSSGRSRSHDGRRPTVVKDDNHDGSPPSHDLGLYNLLNNPEPGSGEQQTPR